LGTSQPIAPKYVVQASFSVDGVVEKSDVIGALFGQTEGLFGPELDLHELQKTGRIGRIEIQIESRKDKTSGIITIPSSLDKPLTALIAATVENVDRVGPCIAKVTIGSIEDIREKRREEIITRAKDILRRWTVEETPTTEQVTSWVVEAIMPSEIVAYGSERLAAGPDVEKSPSIIIVEGRADVANLLRAGVKNAIACEGANISDSVVKLSQNKEVTLLLDGDRGGDIILEAMLRIAKIDYVARAPRGREVEELTPKQVLKILSERVPISKIREERAHLREYKEAREEKPLPQAERAVPTEKAPPPEKPVPTPERREVVVPDAVSSFISELRGSLEAVVLDEKLEPIERMPVSELAAKLQSIQGAHTVVFDGVITQRLVDIASEKGVKRIVGDRISGVAKRPLEIQLLTAQDVLTEQQP
jgi:DNA primase